MSNASSFAELAKLRAHIGSLPSVNARVAAKVAPVFSQLAQQAFDANESPYGDTWGLGKDGKQITEYQSGRLRSLAVRYSAVGTNVRSSISAVRYARYQLSHGILPKSRALPAAWYEALSRIAEREIAEALRV